MIRLGFALLIAAGACLAADQAIPQMRRGTGSVKVDAGLLGSKSRKPSKAFSGTPQMPVQTKTNGPKSAVSMPAPNRPDGSTQNSVTISSGSRRAQLVDVNSTGAAARKAAALKAQDSTVTASSLAQMISPVYGSTLAAEETFAWTAASGADRYALWIGSCQDCVDLLDEDEAINLSRTVDMPLDGRRIYVSLFTRLNGNWYWIDYQFNASRDNQPVAAQLITPSNGSTLTSPQTLVWQAGNLVADYWIWMGTCFECNDVLNQDQGQNLSTTLNMPGNGGVTYMTLFSYIGGNWYWYDYAFRNPSSAPEQLVTVNITNQLAYALDIYVNGANVGSVPAFSTAGTTLPLSSLLLAFEVDQPRVGSQILGDAFAGYWNAISYPSGTYNFVVNNVVGNDVYFAPMISNQTPQALEAGVNVGLVAQNLCDCDVNAFTKNVLIGYYLLYSNSNVELFYHAANYTGPFVFWGQDQFGTMDSSGPLYQYVAVNSGLLQLIATNLP